MVSIDASELNALAANLGAAGERLAPKARDVLRKTAFDIERDGKLFAPVDTGNLRSSISTQFKGNAFFSEAEIGPTAEYAHYVEFGTSRMAPHAFMGPALDRNTPAFVKAAEAVAREALDE